MIGADTHVLAHAIVEAKQAAIVIGPRSLVNVGAFIGASFGIAIGADALIAEYVTIRDADHGAGDPTRPFHQQAMQGAHITIGDSVWLGAKVTVTKGVVIGSRAIVGANAVVTRSLEGDGRYVGAPARPIRGGTR
ncbi:acyltransferase [Sphingomonas abietis]|uniref:Acyltransferase n=1 Tax=Sphingomonas abietis TaxID=3012344 RepID=A0ABY7NTK1_9SPHN|nr:acyltransferase [Sphingomonas abietis]WBO24230.1 acyltransferase [Sphingomonas abietis]